MAEKSIVNFQVKGEGPAGTAPALFSNFVAVSQVGTEVQFEFVFLDLNLLAGMLEKSRTAGATSTPPTVEGKTIAKVVMPAAVFVQLKEHFDRIYNSLAQEGIPSGVPEEQKR